LIAPRKAQVMTGSRRRTSRPAEGFPSLLESDEITENKEFDGVGFRVRLVGQTTLDGLGGPWKYKAAEEFLGYATRGSFDV
jgi:hypothetical protein